MRSEYREEQEKLKAAYRRGEKNVFKSVCSQCGEIFYYCYVTNDWLLEHGAEYGLIVSGKYCLHIYTNHGVNPCGDGLYKEQFVFKINVQPPEQMALHKYCTDICHEEHDARLNFERSAEYKRQRIREADKRARRKAESKAPRPMKKSKPKAGRVG